MDGPIASRFRPVMLIGKGSFGEVYKGEDETTGIPVAIKFEAIKSRFPQLGLEARIYETLAGGVNIPKTYFYGLAPSGLHEALVMDLLSRSLEDQVKRSKTGLSLKSVLMLADQLISSIEWVHKHGIVHRDIKPDNFMLGNSDEAGHISIIDFGLSARFQDSTTGRHNPFTTGKSLTGTARYASINAMRGFAQSRRDDLESLGYVLIYLVRASLPWQGLQAPDDQTRVTMILRAKMMTSVEALCSGLPPEFAVLVQKTRILGYEEEPPYAEYRQMFRDRFLEEGLLYDGEFDWMPKEGGHQRPWVTHRPRTSSTDAVVPPNSSHRALPLPRAPPMNVLPPLPHLNHPPAVPRRSSIGQISPGAPPQLPRGILKRIHLPTLTAREGTANNF
jgi:serine/threonine protein kinase